MNREEVVGHEAQMGPGLSSSLVLQTHERELDFNWMDSHQMVLSRGEVSLERSFFIHHFGNYYAALLRIG